jgi:hypothetical protein
LTARVIGLALLVAAPVCAVATQSDRFGGHEIPPFVCDRIELTPDLAVDGSWRDPWTGALPGWVYAPTGPGSLCPPRAPALRSYG